MDAHQIAEMKRQLEIKLEAVSLRLKLAELEALSSEPSTGPAQLEAAQPKMPPSDYKAALAAEPKLYTQLLPKVQQPKAQKAQKAPSPNKNDWPKPSSKEPTKAQEQKRKQPMYDEEERVSLRPEKPSGEFPSYLRNRRFILDQKTRKPWRFSQKTAKLPEEQVQLIEEIWNHIRAGTMSPAPVRELEKLFSKLQQGQKADSTVKSGQRLHREGEGAPLANSQAKKRPRTLHYDETVPTSTTSNPLSSLSGTPTPSPYYDGRPDPFPAQH